MGRKVTPPCPDEVFAFPLQWLVLHVHDLLSFPSSLPPLNRMVVFQIYLQFKLQKRNLDPLVCKPCIKDSFILGITRTFSWIMLLSINDKWSTCSVVYELSWGAFQKAVAKHMFIFIVIILVFGICFSFIFF